MPTDQHNFWSMGISVFALVASFVSLVFAIRSWRETHRPLVTVRVTSASGGNVGAALNLCVENTGNRPAKNVRLRVHDSTLARAFLDTADEDTCRQVRACFEETFTIPVLANGATVTNAFGYLSHREGGTWKVHSRIAVRVHYEDLDGRAFSHSIDLFVADNTGFASAYWS